MGTIMNRQSQYFVETKTFTQKVCIYLGVFLIIVGLGGVVVPGILGMHLSLTHNVIHLASGALGIWSGYAEDVKRSYVYCFSFGVLFGVLGLVGFVFGTPGFPSVGNLESEDYLLRIIPNVLEVGTVDHFFHLSLGAILLASSFVGHRIDQKRQSRIP
jgi:hypothetical protein